MSIAAAPKYGGHALNRQPVPIFSVGALGIAVYLDVVTMALALGIQTWAQRHISATETTLIMGLEPLWGAGRHHHVAETYTPLGWFGCSLVALSIIWPHCQSRFLRHTERRVVCAFVQLEERP